MGLEKDRESILIPSKNKKLNFNDCYVFWAKILENRAINIFLWDGLPFPQHEVELIYCHRGMAVFTELPNSILPYDVSAGNLNGVTNYFDLFTSAIYNTPINTGARKVSNFLKKNRDIKADCVVGVNNSTKTPTSFIIRYYATLLAHIDLTIQSIAINDRANDILSAINSTVKNAIEEWYRGLIDGKTLTILNDKSFTSLTGTESLNVLELNKNKSVNVATYYDLRRNILRDFYCKMGIATSPNKRERVVTDEVDIGFNEVMFNISDMLACRERTADELSTMFRTKISVKINPAIVQQATNLEGGEGGEASTDNTAGGVDDHTGKDPS